MAIKRKGYKKSNYTKNLLGADFETVKKHIERQFKKGMTWKNNTIYGWHIDHKIPLASAKTEDELIALFHYTNLQPLWADENKKKSDKIFPTQMMLTI